MSIAPKDTAITGSSAASHSGASPRDSPQDCPRDSNMYAVTLTRKRKKIYQSRAVERRRRLFEFKRELRRVRCMKRLQDVETKQHFFADSTDLASPVVHFNGSVFHLSLLFSLGQQQAQTLYPVGKFSKLLVISEICLPESSPPSQIASPSPLSIGATSPVDAGVMKLWVKTLMGKPFNLSINPRINVGDLKSRIEEQEGIPDTAQQILFEGHRLLEDSRLDEVGIHHISTLHLVVKLVGGADVDMSIAGLSLETTERNEPDAARHEEDESMDEEEEDNSEEEAEEVVIPGGVRLKASTAQFLRQEGLRLVADKNQFRKVVSSYTSQHFDDPAYSTIEQLDKISSFVLENFGRRRLDFSSGSPLQLLLNSEEGEKVAEGLAELSRKPLSYIGENGVQEGWLQEVGYEELLLPWQEKQQLANDDGQDEEEESQEEGSGSRKKKKAKKTREAKGKGKVMGEKSRADEEVTAIGGVYLREVVMTVEEAKRCFDRFGKERPAESPWVILMLDQLDDLLDEEIISIKYFGQSGFLTAAGRAAGDKKSDSQVRFSSFLKINDLYRNLRFYSLKLPSRPLTVTTPRRVVELAFREMRALQDCEVLCISMIGYTRGNSALGGFNPSFLPSPLLVDLRDHVDRYLESQHDLAKENSLPSLPDFTRRQPRSPLATERQSRKKQIRRWEDEVRKEAEDVYYQQLEFWSEFDPNFVRPNEHAESDIILNSSSIKLSPDGYPRSIANYKDITEEALHSTEIEDIRFYNSRSGQAAATLREFSAFLHNDPSILVPPTDPDAQYIRDHFSPFIDLWAISRDHTPIIAAIIVMLRYYLRVKSPFLKIYSAKLAGIFLVFGVNRIFRSTATRADLDLFIEGDNTVVKRLFNLDLDTGTWSDQAITDFMREDVGRITVIPLLPEIPAFADLDHYRLCLFMIHPGALKYDPIFEAELSLMMAFTELKAKVIEETCVLRAPKSDEPSLVAIRQLVEEVSVQVGITEALNRSIDGYLEGASAVKGIRRQGESPGGGQNLVDFNPREILQKFETASEVEREEMAKALTPRLREVRSSWSTEKAQGGKHSMERRQQMARLEALHEFERRRGNRPTVPQHDRIPVGSEAWRTWFLEVFPDRDLQRSFSGHLRTASRSPSDSESHSRPLAQAPRRPRHRSTIPSSQLSEEDRDSWRKLDQAVKSISEPTSKGYDSSRRTSNSHSIGSLDLLALLVDPTRPRAYSRSSQTALPNYEAFDVRCHDCGDQWFVEGVFGVENRANHRCEIVETGEASHSAPRLKKSDFKRSRQQAVGQRAAKSTLLSDPSQFSLFPVYYPHQVLERRSISPSALPANFTSFSAVDLLLDPRAPPLSDKIKARLDVVTSNKGLSALDLGFVVDYSDDNVPRPDLRFDWRRFQAESKLLIHLSHSPIGDSTLGGGGTLRPAGLRRPSKDEIIFWTDGRRFTTFEKMFIPASAQTKTYHARRERAGYTGGNRYIHYARCQGEDVRLEEDKEESTVRFQCSGQVFTAASELAKVKIAHQTIPGVPPSSIHHERGEVRADFSADESSTTFPTLLSLPPLLLTRIHLAMWNFNDADMCRGRQVMKNLETNGINVLDW
ncbi:uncharacterized protein JCM6883_001121 [Sporobolomyces salmoneus]|uniref:uncharacterized protein n=1 Tax=Sporobolomyces salmoneus TaxID=183962 RepID=UPI00317B4A96